MLVIQIKVYVLDSDNIMVKSHGILLKNSRNEKESTAIVLTKYIKNSTILVSDDSEPTLENARLDLNNMTEGMLILNSYEENNSWENLKNDNVAIQESNTNNSFSNLDIASFVISWSGFALTFLTIVAGVLSFAGFKEIKDLQKARDDVKLLKEKYNVEVNKIEDLEKSSKAQLELLKKQFEDEAQSIMYATYYYSMGSNIYISGQYREAIQYLKKAIQYYPKNTDAICLIGRAYSFVGQKDKSYEYYQKALSIDDNCAAAFRGLASWYRYENSSKALEYAKKAAENASEDPEILNYYGQLLRDNNKLSEAMDVYLKSYSIRKLPDTSFFLSILYLAEDSKGRARIYIQEAIEGYNNKEEFGVSKPVWKELAIWVQILLEPSDDIRFDNALHQLNNVKDKIDTNKTKTVVMGHIEFVLKSMKQPENYISLSKQRIN